MCVVKEEGQPARMEIEHMHGCMYICIKIHTHTHRDTHTHKSEQKRENPLVHISVTTSPLLMTPLVSPSAHIYLSTRSLWVQLLRLVSVCMCVCDDVCF